MLRLLVGAIVTAVGFSSAADAIAAGSVELTERTAITLILESTGYIFPDEQGCDAGPTSVGRYIADSLLLASADTDMNLKVTITCEPYGSSAELSAFYSSSLFARAAGQQLEQIPQGATLQQCTLTLGTNNSEARWARGVQVLIDETTPRIIEGSARCISTP